MNPWPMVAADLRGLRWIAWVVPVVVAVAVAIGIAVGAQERSLRLASARAADDFDLLVGAPGSQAQLVLTTVYLQPDALTLTDGAVLNALAADPRVVAAAPIAFGDMVHGYPVVGTTAAFAGRWGRLTPESGRMFAAEGEAVIGADVRLDLGARVVPAHGLSHQGHLGEEGEEEAHHHHEGESYLVVGRMPRLGSPWDRAILVPVESVWEIHGLGNGHDAEDVALGPPFQAAHVPGVPAVVVKPRGVGDAYGLRAQYRQGGTMALFPAEVLVSVYRNLGDVAQVLKVVAALNDLVVFVCVLFLLIALVGLRRRRYAVLRALGAPPAFVLATVWLGAFLLLGLGCVGGLGLAWGVAALAGQLIEARTGLHLGVHMGAEDLAFAAMVLAAGSLFALGPALAVYRVAPHTALRGGD